MRANCQRAQNSRSATATRPIAKDVALATAGARADTEAFHFSIPKHRLLAVARHQRINRALCDLANVRSSLADAHLPSSGHHRGITKIGTLCYNRWHYATQLADLSTVLTSRETAGNREPQTLNQRVEGSSPPAPTIKSDTDRVLR